MTQMLADAPTVASVRSSTERCSAPEGVTVIIPCYNEQESVAETLRQVSRTIRQTRRPHEIIVVDDGSTDGTAAVLDTYDHKHGIRTIREERNCGYGRSIKTALQEARHEIIVITDADGTYPNERIGELVDLIEQTDMVVGARTGVHAGIPLMRRPAKWALRRLAGYLAGTNIPDLNSGLRVMKRSLVNKFMHLLPDGFSFTTTITLALLTHGYRVRYVPIDYARRVGTSSIRPIRDTVNFISLIVRTVMYFKPLKIFGPASALLLGAAIVLGLVSKLVFGQLADVSVLVIAMASLQVLGIGLLADLIDKRLAVGRASADEAVPSDVGSAAPTAGTIISQPDEWSAQRTLPRGCPAPREKDQ
jgi:glycosyltransferase involved in cell wall biosynthesis